MPWIPRHQYDDMLNTLDSVADTIIRLGKLLTERQQEVDRLTLELAAAQADSTRAFAQGFDAGHGRGLIVGVAQGKNSVVIEGQRTNRCVFQTNACTGNAYLRMDPYDAEIYGDDSLAMICDACAYERAQDI